MGFKVVPIHAYIYRYTERWAVKQLLSAVSLGFLILVII